MNRLIRVLLVAHHVVHLPTIDAFTGSRPSCITFETSTRSCRHHLMKVWNIVPFPQEKLKVRSDRSLVAFGADSLAEADEKNVADSSMTMEINVGEAKQNATITGNELTTKNTLEVNDDPNPLTNIEIKEEEKSQTIPSEEVEKENEKDSVNSITSGDLSTKINSDESEEKAVTYSDELGAAVSPAISPIGMDGSDETMPQSPPLSFRKFLTMQEKRVVVTISFTERAGLRSFFLTAAQRIKIAHPDVLIEKKVLPSTRSANEKQNNMPDPKAVFEIQVDGRKVVGNAADKKLPSSTGTAFVPMQELGLAISKARKRRRPSTFYGSGNDPKNSVRLEMLRKAMTENMEGEDSTY